MHYCINYSKNNKEIEMSICMQKDDPEFIDNFLPSSCSSFWNCINLYI